MTFQNIINKVKIKAIGLMHNYITRAVCWNHDWRSKSNGSMSMVSTKWLQFMVHVQKVFVTLRKGQEMVKGKTTGLVHNFIIPANCWNHDWRSKSNSLLSYGVHKVNPGPFMVLCMKNKRPLGLKAPLFIIHCLWPWFDLLMLRSNVMR